jgi:hypothetical protein
VSGINYDPPEFGVQYAGCRVDHSKEVEAIKAQAYLEGFRAAREAAAKECEWVKKRTRDDGGSIQAEATAQACVNLIRCITDPQPGTAGDEKDSK